MGLAAMFSQIVGLMFSIPYTTISPQNSFWHRMVGGIEIAAVIRWIQQCHLRMYPEAEFDVLREAEPDPVMVELDGIVRRAMDDYVTNRNYVLSEPFALRTGTSVDDHPAMHALNNFLQKQLHPRTPEFVAMRDAVWKEMLCIFMLVFIVVMVWFLKSQRDRNTFYGGDGLSTGLEKLRGFIEQRLQEISTHLQDTIRSSSGGDDAFATRLETFRDSIGQELRGSMTTNFEQVIRQELQTIRDGGSGDYPFTAHLETFRSSIDQVLQENTAIRQELHTIRSERSGNDSIEIIKHELQENIITRLNRTIQTEFERMRNDSANFGGLLASIVDSGEVGDSNDSSDGPSGLESVRNTYTLRRERYTNLHNSIDMIPGLVSEILKEAQNSQSTEALNRITNMDSQLHTLEKRIDDLESTGSKDNQQIDERVSELGNQLVEFKGWLERLQTVINANAPTYMVEQLDKKVADYTDKLNNELDKVNAAVASLESQPAPLDQSLLVSQEDHAQELDRIKTKISTLSAELANVRNLCDNLHENLQNAATQDEQNAKLEELGKTVTATTEKIQLLKEMDTKFEKRLEIAVKGFAGMLASTDNFVGQMRVDVDKGSTRLDRAEEEIQDAKEEIDDNVTIAVELRQRLTKVESNLATTTETCNERAARLDKAEEAIEEAKVEHRKTADRLSEDIKTAAEICDEKLAKAEQSIETARETCDKREERLTKAEVSIETAKENYNKTTNTLADAAASIQTETETCGSMHGRLTQAELSIKAMADKENKTGHRLNKVESEIETHSNAIDQLEYDVEQCQKDFESIKDDNKTPTTYTSGVKSTGNSGLASSSDFDPTASEFNSGASAGGSVASPRLHPPTAWEFISQSPAWAPPSPSFGSTGAGLISRASTGSVSPRYKPTATEFISRASSVRVGSPALNRAAAPFAAQSPTSARRSPGGFNPMAAEFVSQSPASGTRSPALNPAAAEFISQSPVRRRSLDPSVKEFTPTKATRLQDERRKSVPVSGPTVPVSSTKQSEKASRAKDQSSAPSPTDATTSATIGDWAEEVENAGVSTVPHTPKTPKTPSSARFGPHTPAERAAAVRSWKNFRSSEEGKKSKKSEIASPYPGPSVSIGPSAKSESVTSTIESSSDKEPERTGAADSQTPLASDTTKDKGKQPVPDPPGGLETSQWAPTKPSAEDEPANDDKSTTQSREVVKEDKEKQPMRDPPGGLESSQRAPAEPSAEDEPASGESSTSQSSETKEDKSKQPEKKDTEDDRATSDAEEVTEKKDKAFNAFPESERMGRLMDILNSRKYAGLQDSRWAPKKQAENTPQTPQPSSQGRYNNVPNIDTTMSKSASIPSAGLSRAPPPTPRSTTTATPSRGLGQSIHAPPSATGQNTPVPTPSSATGGPGPMTPSGLTQSIHAPRPNEADPETPSQSPAQGQGSRRNSRRERHGGRGNGRGGRGGGRGNGGNSGRGGGSRRSRG